MMQGVSSLQPLLLVICTGNVCRSPMAEALLAHQLEQYGLAAQVISRGLAAPVGRPPHPYAVEVAAKHGIYMNPEKKAEELSTAEIMASLAIFVMDESHRQEIQARFPTATGKTFLLGHWQAMEIDDPINAPRTAFESVWRKIEVGVTSWRDRLQQSGMLQVHAA